jgi:hypothetical protein
MAIKNAGALSAKATYINSKEFANEEVDPSCTKCAETPPIRAIILYPNIGTPLIVEPGEQYLTFFIAAEESSASHFGVRNIGTCKFPSPALSGYRYVDKHLRFYSISNKKTKEDTSDGRLWNDGKLCGKAYKNVKVWCLGPLTKTITDIDGNIFANIRPRTLEQYRNISSAHPDPDDKNAANVPLKWVYQIRIKLDSIPNCPSPGTIASLAWMVAMPEKYKKQIALSGISDWEYQDKLIYDFLESQKKNSKKSHFPDLYEFSIGSVDGLKMALPEQARKVSHRLKAWHPFTIGKKERLVIGHLTDVHINCRQFVMAKSDVQVIEGISPKLGSKVDVTFLALKNLFDEMKKEGADILFITGDLLDFNRNLDPNEVGSTVMDQWKKFNVNKNIKNGSIYKRGLDDMLMYSLLRYSYEILKLPVFVTTGNHEAYDVPYGISPRKNKSTLITGFRELTGEIKPPGWDEPTVATNKTISDSENFILHSLQTGRKLWNKGLDHHKAEFDKGKDYFYSKAEKETYATGKANEGIAADHNLTIYEACLIYGPTYAQALTSENFTADNCDWFYTLFTPLSDYVIDYADQRIIGLDWGPAENYLNAVGGTNPQDFQGIGILPRSVDSINETQKNLLENAFSFRKRKPSSTLLFSHFTFINFGLGVPFKIGEKQNIVKHRVEDFNEYNFGTCEREQRWLYDACINNNVQYHFSGHSHRSGVYTVGELKAQSVPNSARFGSHNKLNPGRDVCSVSGFDPGLELNHKDNNGTRSKKLTKLIVSSCGGPIGVQNQNQELYGFNMQLPSGTLLNEDAIPPIRLIKTDAKKVPFSKPRLCVALDYLWIMWKMSGEAEDPIFFMNPDQMVLRPATDKIPPYLNVRLGKKIQALECISEISFFAHIEKKNSAYFSKIATKFEPDPAGATHSHRIKFDNEGVTILNLLIDSYADSNIPTLFCEVTLKAPKGFAVQHYNWEDKWYFPVTLEKMSHTWWSISRPNGALGEIPNWYWLKNSFVEKYPSQDEIIK